MGASYRDLEKCYGKSLHLLGRENVEQKPDELLLRAETDCVVFLCAGDPMISTTHADLRMRAAERGISTSNFNPELRFYSTPEIVVINPVPVSGAGA
jgi:diphthine synthase